MSAGSFIFKMRSRLGRSTVRSGPQVCVRAGMSWQTVRSIVIGVAFGVAVGIGGFTFIYARGYSYLTNDPQACVNCHVMREQFDGWVKSSHRSVATCNDCHTPYNFVGKYYTKARNGFWHSFYFTTGGFPEPIRIGEYNHAVTEHACQTCHKWPEEELKARVETIQGRTFKMRNIAMDALVQLINDIKSAKDSGKSDQELAQARDFRRPHPSRRRRISKQLSV